MAKIKLNQHSEPCQSYICCKTMPSSLVVVNSHTSSVAELMLGAVGRCVDGRDHCHRATLPMKITRMQTSFYQRLNSQYVSKS